MIWRPMTRADLASVDRIADEVHPPHLFEPRDAFESRLALGAAFCFTLARDGAVFGYAVAHPWDYTVPKLAAVLSPVSTVSTLWLHDLALAPPPGAGGMPMPSSRGSRSRRSGPACARPRSFPSTAPRRTGAGAGLRGSGARIWRAMATARP